MYWTKSFTFSLEEINREIGDPVGKDLFFVGTLYDYYFLETLSGTAVTHVYKVPSTLTTFYHPLATNLNIKLLLGMGLIMSFKLRVNRYFLHFEFNND